jgi:BirA family biotin operon repressor/biotin-[acetyl-CoA-carboxylase] ligase
MTTTENQPRISIERLDVVDSTSAYARRLIGFGGFGDRPRLIVAGEQTGGVGRFGRAWASPRGGLWMTLGWPVAGGTAAGVIDGLGLRVGLAVLRAIDGSVVKAPGHDSGVRIKWPNDILIGGRKVAGVLCEVIGAGAMTHVLVGVGVNGNFPAFELPESLRPSATTLLEVNSSPVDLERLLDDLVERLAGSLTGQGISGGEIAEIERRLHGLGETVTVTMPDRSTLVGTALGLTGDGRLRLRTADGECALPSGAELAAAG